MTPLTFPKQALRGSFADFREYARPVTGAHAAHLFASWWACLATAIGSSRYGYWSGRVVPAVYAVCLGQTADHKSTAMDLATNLLPEGIKTVSGVSSDAGLFDALGDEQGQQPVLLHFDELGFLLGMASIRGQTLDAMLNRLWTVPGHLDRNLSRGNPSGGARRLEKPFVSMLAGTHPRTFWKQIQNRDLAIASGFVNRLAVFLATETLSLPITAEPDPALADDLRGRLRKLRERERACEVHLSQPALEYWRAIVARLDGQVREAGYPVDAVASRIRDHIARLALVYAVDREDIEVSLDDLDAANAVGSYILASYRALLDANVPEAGPGRATAIEDRARDILRRRAGQWMTCREISHLWPDSSSRPSASELRRVLESLDGVEVEDASRQSQKKPRYRHPPGVPTPHGASA